MALEPDVVAAHLGCIRNRDELNKSKMAGCFFCLGIYPASNVEEWIHETRNETERTTGMCPKCGIDAVVGDASGYPVTDVRFLKNMRAHWFDIPHRWDIEGTGNA